MRRALWLLVALGCVCNSGCGGTDRTNAPMASTFAFDFEDVDWVRGQYFLLYDPNFGTYYDVDEPSIRVYRDDANAGNNFEVKPGLAMIDPDGALQLPLSSEQETTAVRGQFNILTPGPGEDYEILHNVYAFHDTIFKVIRLRQPIQTASNQTLAVSYTARPIVGPGMRGAPIMVGGRLIGSGPDSGAIVLKLLRVPREFQPPAPDGLHFDENAPLAIVRELELKGFYNLGPFSIDSSTFTLSVRLGQTDPPVTSSNGVPFIEMFGLDSWNESGSIPVRGHDGHVDATGYNTVTRGWIDYANGVLFLPDARPFAPRLDAAHPFDRLLDAQLNRRLRLGDPGAPNPGGEDIYELYNPRVFNAQWFLEARFSPPPPTHAKQ